MVRGEWILLINNIFDKAPQYAFEDLFGHIEDLFKMNSINPDVGEIPNHICHNWDEDFEAVSLPAWN